MIWLRTTLQAHRHCERLRSKPDLGDGAQVSSRSAIVLTRPESRLPRLARNDESGGSVS